MDSVVEGREELDVLSEVALDRVVVAVVVDVDEGDLVVVVVVGSGQITNSGQLQMSILESK